MLTKASYGLPQIDLKSYVEPNASAKEGNTIKRARICVNMFVFTDLIRIGYSDSTNSLYKTAKVGFGVNIPI
jgi:hypothetical protein